jgi:hypothetical protein
LRAQLPSLPLALEMSRLSTCPNADAPSPRQPPRLPLPCSLSHSPTSSQEPITTAYPTTNPPPFILQQRQRQLPYPPSHHLHLHPHLRPAAPAGVQGRAQGARPAPSGPRAGSAARPSRACRTCSATPRRRARQARTRRGWSAPSAPRCCRDSTPHSGIGVDTRTRRVRRRSG